MQDIDRIRTAVAYAPGFIDFQHAYHPYVGTQIAVRVDGELLLNEAFGVADVETGQPLTVEHLFRIASHSKTFTGVACLQLLEAGKLRLDDTAGHWIPGLADSAMGSVTVRELLGHGSGMIRDGEDSTWWELARSFPNENELVEVVRAAGKVMERNEAFKYSNIGYSLLGMIVAAASGQTYRAYTQEHIMDRLGLANTGPDLDPLRANDYASGHSSRAYSAERRVIDHIDTHSESSATGFYSTAAELTDYFSAHLDGDDRLIGDDSKRMMRQVQWQIEETWGYGLGLSITKVHKRTYYGHGGGYPGHITMSKFDPDRKLAISVFTNSIDGPASTICEAVLGLIEVAMAKETKTDPRSAEELARFEGRYAGLWGVHDVANLGGRLYMIDPRDGPDVANPSELEVVSDSELRLVSGAGSIALNEPLKYTFHDGRVVEIWGPGGMRWVPLADFELPERVTRPG